MTEAAVKQRKPKSTEPVILTWDLSAIAGEVYWPGFGGQAVSWMAAMNDKHFASAVPAEPMVFTRTSATCGHAHPTVALECDPRKGFDSSGPAFAGNAGYQYPKPLQSIRRGYLLRWLMRRYLEIKGLDARVGRDDWNQLVMRLHHELTSKRIWASRRTETYREERDQQTGLSRRVLDVLQPPSPTGQPSISWDLVRNWPIGSVELGEITKEAAQ